MSFEKLFEPGEIAAMKLKNRLVMAPMATTMASPRGEVTKRMIEYYRRRAKGGVGLIIVELTLADLKLGDGLLPMIRTLNIMNPTYVAELHQLVEAVHDYGAKIAFQLSAGGGKAVILGTSPGGQPVSCSPVPYDFTPNIVPRELTIKEIEYLVEAQGKAAARIKQAGADAIEMHAHGVYLMAQFMSSRTNRRTDRYGGSLENRLRFAIESIQSIKSAVGNDFPLIFRFSVDEFSEGGREIEESKIVAGLVEKAGVHCIDASAGVGGATMAAAWFIPPSYLPKGAFVHLAEALKQVVKIPVIVAGRLGDPYMAEKVLEQGKADFVSLGRPLICDPDWPRKVASGNIEDIRSCISCIDGCLVRKSEGRYLNCVLNPIAGRELDYSEPPLAEKKKKVVVIGGGPGGMEAARVAGLRGHNVVLYEKSKELGGSQLRAAMAPPGKEDLAKIIQYYEAQFKKMRNVTLKLGVEATANAVKNESPDAVILATGSEPLIPAIPGMDRSNVVTAQAILNGEVSAGTSAVIVGFGMVGCEAAHFLAEQGKAVTLLDIKKETDAAIDVNFLTRLCLMSALEKKAVKIRGSRQIKEINDIGVRAMDDTGNEEIYPADIVVLATGSKSVAGLEAQIASLVGEYCVIGDAREPRRMMEAIWEGFRYCYEL